ncbi:MAG: HlyD family secretion protein [Oscillatoria princeps RMCB-10]|nr:HlyD family secretion protein [Oscillatoria princeps RMCB-10]
MKSAQPFDRPVKPAEAFDQPVILEPPAIWAQIFVWLIVGVTTSALLWAYFAKIDQAVPAVGKLEPEDAAQDVRPPTGGVVREVLVKDGAFVKKGEILLTLDPTSPQADVETLRNQREALLRENQFYDKALSGGSPVGAGSDLESLSRERNALQAENDVYQALIDGSNLLGVGAPRNFNTAQQTLWEAHRREYIALESAGRLKVEELDKQRSQVIGQKEAALRQVAIANEQLPKARSQVATAQVQLEKIQQQKAKNEEVLALNKEILDQVSPLVEEGAVSKLQRQRQEQEVLTRQAEVLSGESQLLTAQNEIVTRQREVLNSQNEMDARQAEAARLQAEEQRINVEMERTAEEWNSSKASWLRDKQDKIQSNKQRIAQLDNEISQKKLENQKQLTQLNGQLTKAQQALQYQEVRSPIDGYVFDLKAAPGYVAREVEQNPILKIIPNQTLVASVYIQNKDIALVSEGKKVDINIEAFPSMEFGTIEGTLISIGKDALPPTQERQYYSFPAKIKLDRQAFKVDDGREVKLQSGMAVQATIKIGKRTVMDMFLDRMDRKVETLKTVK